MTMKKRVIALSAVAVAGVAGVGLAAGVALADPGSATSVRPGASASPQATAGHKHKAGRAGLVGAKHLLHGEFVTKAKSGYVTVDSQRGAVTAVSATSVSLKSVDGFTATYTVTAGAKVRKDGAASAIGDVLVGDPAVVVATKSGSTLTVKGIVVGVGKAKPAN